MEKNLHTCKQLNPYESSQSLKEKIGLLLWDYCWAIFCMWTPKPLNSWRLIWLKVFGCRINGRPFVHQRARIQKPWNVILHDRACVGDRTNLYSLGEIEVFERATIAQEAYVCTGTHDFSDPVFPLQTAKITIGENSFLGLRSVVLPGVTIGRNAVVGAYALVTKDVEDSTIVIGNPAIPTKKRIINNE